MKLIVPALVAVVWYLGIVSVIQVQSVTEQIRAQQVELTLARR